MLVKAKGSRVPAAHHPKIPKVPLPGRYSPSIYFEVQQKLKDICIVKQQPISVFSHDVTVAILVSQNNETAVMLVSQTSPVRVELFSYVNAFFCSNKFA